MFGIEAVRIFVLTSVLCEERGEMGKENASVIEANGQESDWLYGVRKVMLVGRAKRRTTRRKKGKKKRAYPAEFLAAES